MLFFDVCGETAAILVVVIPTRPPSIGPIELGALERGNDFY
jgi:hypothetical protein